MEVRAVLLPAHGEGPRKQVLRLVQLIVFHDGVKKGLAAVPVLIGPVQLHRGSFPVLLPGGLLRFLQQGNPVFGAQLHIAPRPQGKAQDNRQKAQWDIESPHAFPSFATQVTAPVSSTVMKNTCRGEVRRRSFSCLSSHKAS